METEKNLAQRMDPNVLKNRLQELGWSTYKLAHEVARVREELYGETIKNPKSLITALEKAIESPNRSSQRTIEIIIRAMQGDLVVRWAKTETIVTGFEEIEIAPEQE
jgi:broad-specificity NMP kinase